MGFFLFWKSVKKLLKKTYQKKHNFHTSKNNIFQIIFFLNELY